MADAAPPPGGKSRGLLGTAWDKVIGPGLHWGGLGLLTAGAVATTAVVADQAFNNGNGLRSTIGGTELGKEVVGIVEGASGFVGSAMHTMGEVFSMAAHPGFTPWFQGLAAMGVLVLGWKGTSMFSSQQDSFLMRLASGTGGILATVAAAVAVAAWIGTARADPAPTVNKTNVAQVEQVYSPSGPVPV